MQLAEVRPEANPGVFLGGPDMTTTPRHWAVNPTSRRTAPLPRGWKATRQAVLQRDGYRCVWQDDHGRCTETTQLEVDHIDDPDDHSLDNLRTLCTWHHARRSSAQANAARAARRAPTKRTHPGLVR